MMLIVTCSLLHSDNLSRESVRVYYNMAMYHDGVLCGAGKCFRVLVKKCVHVYANMSYIEGGSICT